MIERAYAALVGLLADRPWVFDPREASRRVYCSFDTDGYFRAADPYEEFVLPAMRAIYEDLPHNLVLGRACGPIGPRKNFLSSYMTPYGVIVYQVGVHGLRDLASGGDDT